MTYQERIQRAQALLLEAQEEARIAGDPWTAGEVAWALAGCRNTAILAEGKIKCGANLQPEG